jgi:CDP-paratose 2-epimerase
MKILITGGAGFVGANLARSFKKENPHYQVAVFDNLRRRGSELNLGIFQDEDISFFHGDIRNPSDLKALPGEFDIFIETSAEPSVLAGLHESPAYLLETNLSGTLNCLEFARKRARCFIFLSTSRVYSLAPLREIPLIERETRFEVDSTRLQPGMTSLGITEAFPTNLPRTLYGATKLASELMVQEYLNSFSLRGVINRCGVIAGPGQFGKVDQGVFTLWVAHHYFKKPLQYTGFRGSGKQVRDLLHPSDLFQLIRRQIEMLQGSRCESINGSIVNAGGGLSSSTSLFELTSLCERVTGNKTAIATNPQTSRVDIPFFVSDTALATQTYGWKPEMTVENIVGDIYDWIHGNEPALRRIFT